MRRIAAGYLGLIAHLDEQIGRSWGRSRSSACWRRPASLYTSDHGDLSGEHGLLGKSCMYEGSIGVPLLISGPGVRAGGVGAGRSRATSTFSRPWSRARGPSLPTRTGPARAARSGRRSRAGARPDRLCRIPRDRLEDRRVHAARGPRRSSSTMSACRRNCLICGRPGRGARSGRTRDRAAASRRRCARSAILRRSSGGQGGPARQGRSLGRREAIAAEGSWCSPRRPAMRPRSSAERFPIWRHRAGIHKPRSPVAVDSGSRIAFQQEITAWPASDDWRDA